MARALWLSSLAAGRAVPDRRCDEGGLNREPVLEVSSQQLRTGLLLAVIANLIWGLAALFWSETALVSPVDVVAHRAVWSLPVARRNRRDLTNSFRPLMVKLNQKCKTHGAPRDMLKPKDL